MDKEGCISCDTVSGQFSTPGGIVYEHDFWIVVLNANPLRSPCAPFIILKRHCEHIQELTDDEVTTLGPLMRLTAQVLTEVVNLAKVHFGLYAEGVKHLHLHVFPRMASMPPGNIPNMFINEWYRMLQRWGLKHPYSEEEIAAIAIRMREVFQHIVGQS